MNAQTELPTCHSHPSFQLPPILASHIPYIVCVLYTHSPHTKVPQCPWRAKQIGKSRGGGGAPEKGQQKQETFQCFSMRLCSAHSCKHTPTVSMLWMTSRSWFRIERDVCRVSMVTATSGYFRVISCKYRITVAFAARIFRSITRAIS